MPQRFPPPHHGERADRAPARDGNFPAPHANGPVASRAHPNDQEFQGHLALPALRLKTPFALHWNFFPLAGTIRPGPCALRADQALRVMLARPKPAPCFFVPEFGLPCTSRCSTMTDAPWPKRIEDQAKLPARRCRRPQSYPRRTQRSVPFRELEGTKCKLRDYSWACWPDALFLRG